VKKFDTVAVYSSSPNPTDFGMDSGFCQSADWKAGCRVAFKTHSDEFAIKMITGVE